jgi:hypothetical protein
MSNGERVDTVWDDRLNPGDMIRAVWFTWLLLVLMLFVVIHNLWITS